MDGELKPQRKNIRIECHDYSGGDYFVTICTRDKSHFFGEIRNDEMRLSAIGRFAQQAMTELETHYPYAKVPLFTIMPNHIHAIISITPLSNEETRWPKIRSALSVVVGGYKQNVTSYARRNNIKFAWQIKFHDHIIRDNRDGNNIAEYIVNNVVRWATDCFNESARKT